MDQKSLEYFKQHLTQSLQDILKRGDGTLEDMVDSAEAHPDPADRATALSDRSMTLLLRDRERKLIRKIQDALERIELRTYGVCNDCGEDIAVARLKARPMTTLCINCKSSQEKEQILVGE